MAHDICADQTLAEFLEMGFEFNQVTKAMESVGPHRDNVLEFLLNPSDNTLKPSQSRPASSLKQPSIKDHVLRFGRRRNSSGVCEIASEKETTVHISSSGDTEKKPCGPSRNPTEREVVSKEASKSKLKNHTSNLGGCEKKLGDSLNASGNTAENEPVAEEVSYNIKTENKIEAVLRKHFGFGSLKGFQKEALDSWSSNKDCLVLAATGSGKSLCFQIPALLTDKVVVVISPLISLMHDQCLKLARHGITACFLGSGQPDAQVEKKAMQGAYKIVYVCPETVVRLMDPLKRLAENPGIALFAVDEAHCVSKWGHDFRPDYRRLSILRENFGTSSLSFLDFDIPIMALTATATIPVREDILKSLKMSHDSKLILTSFFRPNLRFSVEHSRTNAASYKSDFAKLIETYTKSKGVSQRCFGNYEAIQADSESSESEISYDVEYSDDEEKCSPEDASANQNSSTNCSAAENNNPEDELDLHLDVDDFDVSCGEFLERPPLRRYSDTSCSTNLEVGPTLIYVPTRKDTLKVAEFLSRSGVRAAAYHANLPKAHLRRVHQEFHHDELQVVVATVAFGMGIDKSNVRRIIHYGWPQSLEAYYQEAGRAGRDGKLSDCTLFVNLLRAPTLLPSKRNDEQTRQAYRMLSDCYRYGMSTATCRAKTLVKYFGEEFGPNKCHLCDICEKGPPEMQNLTEEMLAFLQELKDHIGDINQRPNFKIVVSQLREKYQKFATSDKLWWQGLARILEHQGYIREGDPFPRVLMRSPEITEAGLSFLQTSNTNGQDKTLCTYPEGDMLVCSMTSDPKPFSTFAEWGRGWADPEVRRQRLLDIRKGKNQNQDAKRTRKRKRNKQRSFWNRRHHDTSTVRGRLAEKLSKRKR
ncbi:RECQ helicase SIM [Rhynchospora pubera]|uniref:ATP-dependent DNA helicase n=1 Tax=Rhynchospora pubera TaxID=906938 RepID=A0AAV8FU91_9POAL|nr:RECQ helicase SIM [Rhynchospora pubera]